MLQLLEAALPVVATVARAHADITDHQACPSKGGLFFILFSMMLQKIA